MTGEARSLGRFKILQTLGRGGMGTVYLAEDPLIGRQVAIKEVLVDPADDEADRAAHYERFAKEFRAAGALSHPNIVTIYDVGQSDHAFFIAMELVSGDSLATILRRRPRPERRRVVTLLEQVADGLDQAHAAGVLHRDVKPGNILVTADDRVKITDFGIAKILGADMEQPATVIGTPGYMSPEQVRGRPLDGRSDQFSLAVLAYQMLVGLPPYRGDTPSAVIYQLLESRPAPPSHCVPELPPSIDAALLRALDHDPAGRYVSCKAMVKALAATLGDSGSATVSVADPVSESAASPAFDHAATQRLGPEFGRTMRVPPSMARRASRRPHPVAILTATAVCVALLAAWLGGRLPGVSEPGPGPVAQPAPGTGATPLAQTGTGDAEGRSTGTETSPSQAAGAPPSANAETASAGTGQPVPPTERLRLRITSDPAGAQLLLDSTDTGLITPAELGFVAGQRYGLTLHLEGYETTSWRFSVEDLSAGQLRDKNLHFPLVATGPRASVLLTADYDVELRVGDQRLSATRRHEVELPAGRHTLDLFAPQVFLRRSVPVVLATGERTELRAPAVLSIRVAAQPGNCTVFVDGRALPEAPPFGLSIVAGRHTFRFDWPDGRTRRMPVAIRQNGQRVFATPR